MVGVSIKSAKMCSTFGIAIKLTHVGAIGTLLHVMIRDEHATIKYVEVFSIARLTIPGLEGRHVQSRVVGKVIKIS
jgi:hypothetical protein